MHGCGLHLPSAARPRAHPGDVPAQPGRGVRRGAAVSPAPAVGGSRGSSAQLVEPDGEDDSESRGEAGEVALLAEGVGEHFGGQRRDDRAAGDAADEGERDAGQVGEERVSAQRRRREQERRDGPEGKDLRLRAPLGHLPGTARGLRQVGEEDRAGQRGDPEGSGPDESDPQRQVLGIPSRVIAANSPPPVSVPCRRATSRSWPTKTVVCPTPLRRSGRPRPRRSRRWSGPWDPALLG